MGISERVSKQCARKKKRAGYNKPGSWECHSNPYCADVSHTPGSLTGFGVHFYTIMDSHSQPNFSLSKNKQRQREDEIEVVVEKPDAIFCYGNKKVWTLNPATVVSPHRKTWYGFDSRSRKLDFHPMIFCLFTLFNFLATSLFVCLQYFFFLVPVEPSKPTWLNQTQPGFRSAAELTFRDRCKSHNEYSGDSFFPQKLFLKKISTLVS